jgi:hypothetical protein
MKKQNRRKRQEEAKERKKEARDIKKEKAKKGRNIRSKEKEKSKERKRSDEQTYAAKKVAAKVTIVLVAISVFCCLISKGGVVASQIVHGGVVG